MPSTGPWRVGEDRGMKEAIDFLRRSMEPGRRGGTVKYSTTRKLNGALTNLWRISPEEKRDVVIASDKKNMVATTSPVQGCWYGSFKEGVLSRMGKETEQDRPLCSEEVGIIMGV
mmetsp:Transcript_28257/g.83228  ORF Transcript_28257/g.83228 Transcript_28257/m.83228 type:complete len:115 (-) Transcript_28257:1126-1470(-)